MRNIALSAALLIQLLCGLSTCAFAQEKAFMDAAEAAYRAKLEHVAALGRLDDNREFLARTQAISSRLAVAAPRVRAGSDSWRWEVHVTSDPGVSAFCMAGGKMLVGSAFVTRMRLDDEQLAMLLAHEMAHALADHRRLRAPSGGMEEDLSWETRQAELARAQEFEADRIGLQLALGAGFALPALLSFYDKLEESEPAGTFNSTHPRAQERAAAAREWAATLASK